MTIEKRLNIEIKSPNFRPRPEKRKEYPHRIELEIPDGHVLIGSDAHYWPGPPNIMHRAFVKFCKDFKPCAVIYNGDVIDGPQISRHPPIGWEKRPQLADEIDAAKERLHEVEQATFKARKIWTLGNHDARFETRLATVAPEYAKIHGVHLHDHFNAWETAWAVWINDEVVVKHRFKNGIHAVHNSTMWAGKTMITGHLHSLKVTPFSDYNGTRWGVDTGTLADPYGPQFTDYSEDSPKNHRQGFVLLTFVDRRLLWPELISLFDDEHVDFRGGVIKV